ncbi:MAG: permease-like cell division protein FtsX [Candidatus Margulisbacteria bacterium]|jgi:cell division transport system permease protein|nr:permease-like cell division protein FtsX [Candidatus Margulisiibacteriota bacterium]
MFGRLVYFSREAWQSVSRGGIMSFIATSTITVSLFIFGVFLLVFFNLYNLLGSLNTRLDIMAYLSETISKNDIDLLHMSIAQIAGVKRIEFVAKETAWMQFKENYNNLRLDEFLDSNPLPDAFKIEVQDLSYIHLAANKLNMLDGIEDVSYGGDLAERMAALIKVMTLAGAVIIFLLVSSTLMIVVNTIRLTVIARENEINIMSLVGASRSFIKYPFIMEGMLIGLTGALLSILGLKAGYNIAVLNLERLMPFMPINLNSRELNLVYLIILLTGVALGWLGGYFSVSKTLRSE